MTSKRRNIRTFNDEDDDSEEEDLQVGSWSASPSTEALYGMKARMNADKERNLFSYINSPKPQRSSAYSQQDEDFEVIQELLPQLQAVVAADITEREMVEALRSVNYDLESAVNSLLKEDLRGSGQQELFELEEEGGKGHSLTSLSASSHAQTLTPTPVSSTASPATTPATEFPWSSGSSSFLSPSVNAAAQPFSFSFQPTQQQDSSVGAHGAVVPSFLQGASVNTEKDRSSVSAQGMVVPSFLQSALSQGPTSFSFSFPSDTAPSAAVPSAGSAVPSFLSSWNNAPTDASASSVVSASASPFPSSIESSWGGLRPASPHTNMPVDPSISPVSALSISANKSPTPSVPVIMQKQAPQSSQLPSPSPATPIPSEHDITASGVPSPLAQLLCEPLPPAFPWAEFLASHPARPSSAIHTHSPSSHSKISSASLPSVSSPSLARVVPFSFDTPSPDDRVLERRGQAFQQKKADTPSRTATVPSPLETSMENLTIRPSSASSSSSSSSLASSSSSSVSKTPVSSPMKKSPSNVGLTSLEEPKSTPSQDRKNLNVKQMPVARRKQVEKWLAERSGEKEHLNLVVIGHVDAGKSTIMGHVLFQLGNVSQKTLHKYEKESKNIGKASFMYAWVLDEQEEERQRGITVDVAVTTFETDHKRITLLDAPGHRDFVPNMISGAAQADVAILVVNGAPGEFEAGFDRFGQTKEHAILAKSLGVSQLGVVVNKMDVIDWSQERFDAVTSKLGAFLKQSGFKEKDVWYLPASGLTGENLSPATRKKIDWYNGPTLVEKIDSLSPPPRDYSKPLRFTVSDVYKAPIFGLALGGKVETGVISVGDSVLLLPRNEICTIKAIRSQSQQTLEYASAGENVDVSVTGIEQASASVGSVLCDPESPVPLVRRFKAQIITFSLTRPILRGHTLDLHTQSTHEPAVIKTLVSKLDNKTGEVKANKPRVLTDGETAVVEIVLQKELPLEKYADFKQLGRFTLREAGRTVAAGVLTEIMS